MLRTLFAVTCLVCIILAQPAVAQEYSSVPAALEQIADPLFRDALASYSPGYNQLPRDAQIAAYANMYSVLNGHEPSLSATEASMLSQHRARQYARPEPQLRTEFDIWDQPPVLMQEGSPSLIWGPRGRPWGYEYGPPRGHYRPRPR